MTHTASPLTFPVALGAVDQGSGKATFSVYAPHKRDVRLIGDMTNWKAKAVPLREIADGLWSVELALEAGVHRYQFVVDDLVVCDPYARAVDGYEPPHVAVLEVGAPAFSWRHDRWPRPDFANLVIYEMHLGDFTPHGTLPAAKGRLGYLCDLGVNAVQLMPMTQTAGTNHWGYEPAYFFAVERRYGTARDFKTFVDEAHGQGLAVIVDMVLAHSSGESPLAQLYPVNRVAALSLFGGNDNPWYGKGVGGKNEFGFPTFDHRKPATQALMRDIQTYWLREFHVDGFRYDYIKNIGYQDDTGAEFLVENAREVFPRAYLIGENLPEQPEKTNSVDLDAVWHSEISIGLKALLCEEPINGFDWEDLATTSRIFDPIRRGYRCSRQVINYVESHDEHRLSLELLNRGFSEEAVQKKLMLAMTLILCAAGEPMLFMGQEWGECSEKTLGSNDLQWGMLETECGGALFDHAQQLIWLRRDRPALRGEGYRIASVDNARKALVLHRWDESGDAAVVAANFADRAQTIQVPFPEPGTWREFFSGAEFDAGAVRPHVLGAYGAAVFLKGV